MATIVEHPTAPVTGSAEVQRLAVSGGTPVSGSIVVGYKNRRVSVPYNATATQFRDLLRGMAEIGPTGVNGAGGPLPGTPIDITFAGNLAAANVPQMAVLSHTLSVGTPAITTTAGGGDASPRGYRKGTVLQALDTGNLYVNLGNENAPVWRRLYTAQGATVADLVATVGTSDGTLADVGATFAQATLNNNFRDLADKVNAILAALRNAGGI